MEKLVAEINRQIDVLVEEYHDHIIDCKLTTHSSQERIDIYLDKLSRLLNELLPAYEMVIVRYPEMKIALDEIKKLKAEYFKKLQLSCIKEPVYNERD